MQCGRLKTDVIDLPDRLAAGPRIVPIPGTTKLRRLEENPRPSEMTLSTADMREIGEFLAAMPVQDAHYPGRPQGVVGR
jgi:hypothetical protein